MSTQHHYSARLKRNYRAGDLLSIPELINEVLEPNSGREVSDRAVADLARTMNLTRERPSPRAVLFHYEEVCNLVVGMKRGRRAQSNPSSNALRQREFKARRAAGDASKNGS
jgi:hypothetical protein